jgi:hypothetical protein
LSSCARVSSPGDSRESSAGSQFSTGARVAGPEKHDKSAGQRVEWGGEFVESSQPRVEWSGEFAESAAEHVLGRYARKWKLPCSRDGQPVGVMSWRAFPRAAL